MGGVGPERESASTLALLAFTNIVGHGLSTAVQRTPRVATHHGVRDRAYRKTAGKVVVMTMHPRVDWST